MATTKRISGDYVIATIGATDNVVINTNTVNVTNALTVTDLTVSGNLSLLGGGDIAVGNISGNNLSLLGDINADGDVYSNAAISAAGNISGAVFIGDGSGLTGIPAGNALGNIISFGTSRVQIPLLSGEVYVNVGGVSNVAIFNTGGANIAGNISANAYYWSNGTPFSPGGSVTYDALPVAPVSANVGDFWFNTTNGILYQYNDDGDSNQWVDQSGVATPPATTSAVANSVVQRDLNGSVTANRFFGNGAGLTGIVTSAANVSNGTSIINIATVNGSITAAVAGTGIIAITPNGIENSQSNGQGNIGSATTYFNTVFAKSTSAQYADLAEIYTSDDVYAPGTVVCFGGTHEITISSTPHNTAVAGVVSENPSYLMNTSSDGIPVALTGKVKCKVQGPVEKGSLLTTSSIPGVAERVNDALYRPGCVLGKSLETIKDTSVQQINIAVGRF